ASFLQLDAGGGSGALPTSIWPRSRCVSSPGGVLNREVPVSIAHHGTDDCGLNAVLRRLEVAPLQRERLLRTQPRVQEEVPQWAQPVASRPLRGRGDLLSGEERRGPLDLLRQLETCRRIGRQEPCRLDRPLERLMQDGVRVADGPR